MGFVPLPPPLSRAEFAQRYKAFVDEHGREPSLLEVDTDLARWDRRQRRFLSIAMPSLFIGGILLLIMFAVLFVQNANGETLTRAIDGDTIVVDGVEHVRLIGVDAPEVVHPGYPKADCYGNEATLQMQLFEGHRVHLYRHGKDRYGRTLAYVYLEKTDPIITGVSFRLSRNSVNLYMIINGFARSYHAGHPWETHKYWRSYDAAATWARDHHEGLWAVCHPESGATPSPP